MGLSFSRNGRERRILTSASAGAPQALTSYIKPTLLFPFLGTDGKVWLSGLLPDCPNGAEVAYDGDDCAQVPRLFCRPGPVAQPLTGIRNGNRQQAGHGLCPRRLACSQSICTYQSLDIPSWLAQSAFVNQMRGNLMHHQDMTHYLIDTY